MAGRRRGSTQGSATDNGRPHEAQVTREPAVNMPAEKVTSVGVEPETDVEPETGAAKHPSIWPGAIAGIGIVAAVCAIPSLGV